MTPTTYPRHDPSVSEGSDTRLFTEPDHHRSLLIVGIVAIIGCVIDFSVQSLLYALSGFLVGLLVGQTGVGGGALMTPLLVLLFGIHPATAVGTDLLFACVTKLVGTIVHGKHKSVDWRIVAHLAAGSVPATTLTLVTLSSPHLLAGTTNANRMIAIVLGLALVLTAVSLVFRPRVIILTAGMSSGLTTRKTMALTVVTGAILGFLVTISSVGAGALGVTALLLLYPKLPTTTVVGSDIAHAVPLTLVAGLGHWWLGSVDGGLLIALLLGSVPGVILGSYLSAHLPDAVLRFLLAAVLALVGARLVF